MCLRDQARVVRLSGGRASCALCYFATAMDLPSSRELELEALLHKKDSQLAELTVCPM